VRSVRTPQEAILRQLEVGGHNLLVMGVSPRLATSFSSARSRRKCSRGQCSVLFVANEPATSAAEPDKTSVVQEHQTGLLLLSRSVGLISDPL
jgi:hypothetical protein